MANSSEFYRFKNWLDVQQKAKDTVVQIFSQILKFNWLEPYKAPTQTAVFGSGFFINNKGHILTNFHVVDEAVSIQIQIPSLGKEQLDVEVVGVYPDMDVALLKLKDEDFAKVKNFLGYIPYLELGDSDEIHRSEEILAIGYPLGQEGLKSTQGIVSGREKIQMLSYIQITAPLNPGNSGGPSLNHEGKVIGINFAGVTEAQNVGYIIPINEIKSAIRDLCKVKVLRRPYLGGIFSYSNSDMVEYFKNPQEGGFFVTKVFPGSILEKAGIIDGDMIYQFNEFKVDRFGEIVVSWSEDKISMLDLLHRYEVGDEITLTLYRRGEKKIIKFKLELSAEVPIRFVYPNFEKVEYEVFGGLVVMEMTLNHVEIFAEFNPLFHMFSRVDVQYNSKLIVTNILHDSQLQRARSILPGDIIEFVNNQKVGSLKEFRDAVAKQKDSNFLTLKTDVGIFCVLAIDKILEDEDRLSQQYLYKKSFLVDLLK
ncbi:TPA: hypothetical protein DEO28_04595 [Candidatus Dependentiae bacterium]|nr:MAG: putative serine protease do-like protein [candidate division TM6 bacterium GW2011_GWE2_31_21]KKP53834.1 MAG: putative serine protease do-like protein [candidate division TM6 bacterium GW2011_GWF2_33_332]HBS47614.1 hypothetical protein [Candidatus Dependentiae bacterium]HBZ73763.1 hypothetical protein [Candidatus Dependentiae bacterium]